MLLAQFRRDIKSATKLEKKMAHRKQIKVKGKGAKSSKSSKLPSEKSTKRKKKVAKIVPESEEYADSEEFELNMETFEQSEPSESVETNIDVEPSQKPSTSSNKKGDDDDVADADLCSKCQTEKEEEWIQCDSCNSWFHRSCAGLRHHKKRKKYQQENAKWFCSECE
jgi:hypothetical protein